MVLPAIRVPIEADATGAIKEIDRTGDAITNLGNRAPRATRTTGGLIKGLSGLSSVSRTTRARVQQVSFQLQDIVVQLQAGTSVATTMTQQLPQLAGAFGAVGAAVGVVASLAIPAVAFAFRSLGDDLRDFEDQLDSLKDSMSKLDDATDLLSISVDGLSLRFGEAAPRVRQFAIAQTQLRIDEINRNLANSFSELNSEIDEFTTVVNRTHAPHLNRQYAMVLRNISDEFGVTRQEAKLLNEAFNEISRSATFEEQQVAVQELLDILTALDVPLNKLPVSLQESLLNMIELSTEADNFRMRMEEAAAAANIIGQTTGIPLFEQGFGTDDLLPPMPSEEEDDDSPRTRTGRQPGRGRIQSLIKQLQTEQETIEQFREDGLKLLAQANDKELELIGGREEAKLRLQQEYMDRLRILQEKERQNTLKSTAGLFDALSSLTREGGNELFNISKGFAIAGALINTYEGITEALKLPPPLSYVEAARVAALGFAQVASIRNTRPGSGGSGGSGGVGGGAAATGGEGESPGRTFVNVNLVGEGAIGRGQVRGLIQLINEEIEDGAVLGGIRVSGA